MKQTKANIIRNEPFIAYIYELLTDAECDYVTQRLEQAKFDQSSAVDFESNESKVTDYRTSQTFYDTNGVFVDYNELVYNAIKHRFWYMPFSVNHIEPVQSQKYGAGQEYKKHCDYFNYGDDVNTKNDRVATLILYLNDDFEGGETEFHELGIKITPKKGSALYFEYNYIPELNYKTMHSGNPVTKGEKLIFTSWIRHYPYTGEGW